MVSFTFIILFTSHLYIYHQANSIFKSEQSLLLNKILATLGVGKLQKYEVRSMPTTWHFVEQCGRVITLLSWKIHDLNCNLAKVFDTKVSGTCRDSHVINSRFHCYSSYKIHTPRKTT